MKKGNLFFAAGLLLIAAALLLTAYNLWDDRRAGKEADSVLEQLTPLIGDDPVPPQGRTVISEPEPKIERVEASPEERAPGEEPVLPVFVEPEIEYPDYVLDPNKEMPVAKIDGKYYVGVISLPSIGRELPVLDEWDYTNLRIAPCRYVGTAYKNDLVICAHNWSSQFGRLKNLSYGDGVTYTDMDGNVFTYRVTEIETLQSTAVEEMTSGDWDLTLFTCTLGGATRVTVRCERTEP